MQLCAALLMNCDVFMRDEPTGHLDVYHIRWLEDRKLKIFKDERQATMAGFQTELLVQPGVEKHLGDFEVDPECASHTLINQLSGGMKVKVVLPSAMWQNPHVLILDELTNSLDREGLGVLVLAISDCKGGVLIISHKKEFRDGIATEKCCKMIQKHFLLDMSQHQITETGFPELSGTQCQLQAAAAEELNDTGASVYYVARKPRGRAGAESEWDEHDEFHDDDDTWYRIREMFEAKLLAELSGKMAGKVELDPAIVVAQLAVTELVADQDRSVAPQLEMAQRLRTPWR